MPNINRIIYLLVVICFLSCNNPKPIPNQTNTKSAVSNTKKGVKTTDNQIAPSQKLIDRLHNTQTVNNTYTIGIAKKFYDDDFLSRHHFKMYPMQNVELMANKLEAEYLGIAVDKVRNVPSLLFVYNLNENILRDIDLNEVNPYYRYIHGQDHIQHINQSGGFHFENNDITNMPKKLKHFLSQNENIYSSNINTQFNNQNQNYFLLKYDYTLQSPEEITEFQPIPAISTVEILDSTWSSIGKLRDLPFHVDDFHVTGNGKYIVLTHTSPIDDAYDESQFAHYFSIYDLQTGNLCFRNSCIDWKYSSGVDKGNTYYSIGITSANFINKDTTIWSQYNLLDEGVLTHYEYINNPKFTRKQLQEITPEGLALKNGTVLKSEINFTSKNLKIKKSD